MNRHHLRRTALVLLTLFLAGCAAAFAAANTSTGPTPATTSIGVTP